MKILKRVLKIVGIILLVAVLGAGGYVGYVLLSYNRIGDKKLDVDTNSSLEEVDVGTTYTAISYNLGFGAYSQDYTFFLDTGYDSEGKATCGHWSTARSKDVVEFNTSGAIQTTLDENPDFVFFQEVDTDSTRSFHVDERDLINGIFAENGSFDNVFANNYHSAYLMYPLTDPHGASNSGLLTESKFTISSALRRSLPIATDFKKLLDLDRCYSISRIPAENGRELVIINQHLSAYGTDAAQGNAQLEKLLGDMQAEYKKGNYDICIRVYATGNMEYWDGDKDVYFTLTIK